MRLPLALLLALAAPAAAQDAAPDPEDTQSRIVACTQDIDVPAVTARAEQWAADADFETRVNALCDAGDDAGAIAFATETQDAFYAQDAEAERLRTCLAGVLGDEAMSPGDICADLKD